MKNYCELPFLCLNLKMFDYMGNCESDQYYVTYEYIYLGILDYCIIMF